MILKKFQFPLLLMIVAIAFVVNNHVIEPNIMEARNLTAAREILQKSNWLEPTMNGELRLEKPPLPTWITAIMMSFSGEDNLTLLRLPSALAAMLLVFFLYKLAQELTKDELIPFLTAATAATSFYIFFLSRDISWDIFCHSFMIGAIWLIHRGIAKNNHGWHDLTWAGILMGLAFMSKGPVPFFSLLLPYLIARSITIGWNGAANKKGALTVMVLLTIAISTWWPLFIWLSHPAVSTAVAQKESGAWINREVRPFYHYWSFPVQSGVWTIMATIALCFPYAKKRIRQFGNYSFLALWVATAVILLSLFPEKKERYLLPVLLPMAILTAFYFRYLMNAMKESIPNRVDAVIVKGNALLMALISFVIPVGLVFLLKEKVNSNFIYIILSFIAFWGTGIMLIGAFVKKEALWLWIGMTTMVLALCLVLMPMAQSIIIKNPDYTSYKALSHRQDLKNVPFYFNGDVTGKFIEVVWNSGHEIKSWDVWNHPELPTKLPILLFSHEDPTTIIPANIMSQYKIDIIGHFDSNTSKKGDKTVLSNYATLIH